MSDPLEKALNELFAADRVHPRAWVLLPSSVGTPLEAFERRRGRRLDLDSATELVRYAIRNNIIEP